MAVTALIVLACLPAEALELQYGAPREARAAWHNTRHRAVRCLQGTSRRSRVDDDDDESISDDDVENLFFLFDDKGSAKPWAVKPHVQGMLQEIERGAAILLDVRPASAWKVGHLEMATSCPMDELEARLDAAEWDKAMTVYTHSSFGDEEAAFAAADTLIRAGYSNAKPLAESYEALKAQLKTMGS